MLYKRVLSGLLFLPIFYLFTWKLHPVYFLALVMAAAILGSTSSTHGAGSGIRPGILLGSALGALVVLDAYHPCSRRRWLLLAASCSRS